MTKNIPNNELYEIISNLLDEYHSTCDTKIKSKNRDLIVSYMMPIVKRIAKTIARRAYDPIEDLTQAGCIGLLKAIDNYSKEINDNFRVYAGYLIIGEMKHFLRDKSNTIRVPAYVQELLIRINSFTQSLNNDELMRLTSEDVASALDLPTKTVDFVMTVDRRCSTVSLEDVFKNENSLSYEELIKQDNYEEQEELKDIKILFDEVIDILPPEEQVLIDMFYKQDLSRREIAEALQISQMAVTRKMKKTFALIHNLAEEIRNSKQAKKEDL